MTTTTTRTKAPRATKTTRTKAAPTLRPAHEGVKEQLLHQRDETRRRIEQAQEDLVAALAEAGSEQGLGDEGEGGSSAVTVDQLRTMLASSRDRLETIETVLERVEAGTYGTCSSCGDPIPEERLEALPTADECVRCKAAGLRHRQR